MRHLSSLVLVLLGLTLIPAGVVAQDSVFLEELTWIEVRDALAAGMTAVIIPTGGTEQNGPHMVLGKHNYLVRAAAGRIAEALGNALVAPVLGGCGAPEALHRPAADFSASGPDTCKCLCRLKYGGGGIHGASRPWPRESTS